MTEWSLGVAQHPRAGRGVQRAPAQCNPLQGRVADLGVTSTGSDPAAWLNIGVAQSQVYSWLLCGDDRHGQPLAAATR